VINARQIEALPENAVAADGDFALDIVARNALDDQLHQAVVEKERSPGFTTVAAAQSSSRPGAGYRQRPGWLA
jgi:hypothetical protein